MAGGRGRNVARGYDKSCRSVAGAQQAGVVADAVAAEVALGRDHADVEVVVGADPDQRVPQRERAERLADRAGELVALVEAVARDLLEIRSRGVANLLRR